MPEGIFRQMTTCQTAANEFLRQFWSATYPPLSDNPVLSAQTPPQRAAKAARMIGYLATTHEKVAAIIQSGQQQGVDPNRVKMVCPFLPPASTVTLTNVGIGPRSERCRPCTHLSSDKNLQTSAPVKPIRGLIIKRPAT